MAAGRPLITDGLLSICPFISSARNWLLLAATVSSCYADEEADALLENLPKIRAIKQQNNGLITGRLTEDPVLPRVQELIGEKRCGQKQKTPASLQSSGIFKGQTLRPEKWHAHPRVIPPPLKWASH